MPLRYVSKYEWNFCPWSQADLERCEKQGGKTPSVDDLSSATSLCSFFLIVCYRFASFLSYLKYVSPLQGNTEQGIRWSAQVGSHLMCPGGSRENWVAQQESQRPGGGQLVLVTPLTCCESLGKSLPPLGLSSPFIEWEVSLRSLLNPTGSDVWGKHECTWPRSHEEPDQVRRVSNARVLSLHRPLWAFTWESLRVREPIRAIFLLFPHSSLLILHHSHCSRKSYLYSSIHSPLLALVREWPHSSRHHFPTSLAAKHGPVWAAHEQRGCVFALHLVLSSFCRLEHRHGVEIQLQPWGWAENKMEVA